MQQKFCSLSNLTLLKKNMIDPKLWLFSSAVITGLLINSNSNAQIVPDGTSLNSSVIDDCTVQCQINGGIRAGNNLFHSFQEFNVRSGESVYFNDPGVANIFSRVTGSNLSQIFGTLGVAGGDANLFLLNPNGIVFGTGARLDVNGSFVATTADEIVFGDRSFSAFPDPKENLALLTINPSAFFYNQMGQGNPITVAPGASLTVPEQQNIVLLGANNPNQAGIQIQDGTIEAPQGRVEIGAVGEQGKIDLTADFQLQFPDDLTRTDLTLTQGSAIDVSGVGGGSVHLEGANINLTEGSTIIADTLGNVDGQEIVINAEQLQIQDNAYISAYTYGIGNGNNIQIDAQQSVDLIGAGSSNYQSLINQGFQGSLTVNQRTGGVLTGTNNLGIAGQIAIATGNLTLQNGAVIGTPTFGIGQGGDINLNVPDTVEINNSGLVTLATLGSQAQAGDLLINTSKLTLADGSIVSTATLGAGDGGNILINASELVDLRRTPPNSVLATGLFTNSLMGTGTGGDLIINTKNIQVEEGALISSSSGLINSQGLVPFGGNGGNITINATESVNVQGASAQGLFPSGIVSDTTSNNNAGNLTINTGKLAIGGEAIVSASAFGLGNGGNVKINATDSVNLTGLGVENLQKLIVAGLSGEAGIQDIGSGLFTVTISGQAGTIGINTPRLTLTDGAIFSTATLGGGKGGDINIKTSEEVTISGSTINSSTLSIGDAGNIRINTDKLLIRDGGLLSTSTVTIGNAGDLLINATESIEMSDSPANFILPGGISTSSANDRAKTGNLTINTKNLLIRDGTRIDTISDRNQIVERNLNQDHQVSDFQLGGDLVINASESILLTGSSPGGDFKSSINSTTNTNAPASNIKITTDALSLENGAEIAVNSTSKGTAGNLDIKANSLTIANGSNLNATTLSGRGGNINLQIQDILQLSDRSRITTDAQDIGNGGNITINSDFVIAFDRSNISANAISGQGGNIDIVAKDIFISPSSRISASSQLGIDGEVNIKTLIQDFRNNLIQLPVETLQAENKIVQGCGGQANFANGEFNYTGKGGLPPAPLDSIYGNFELNLFGDLGNFTSTEIEDKRDQDLNHSFTQLNQTLFQPVVEAQGWLVNSQGNLVLTATANQANPNFSNYNLDLCLFNPQ